MTARDRFQVNDRIETTPSGAARLFRDGQPRRGIVRGFSRDGTCLRIQLDGNASSSNYYAEHWQKVTPCAAQ